MGHVKEAHFHLAYQLTRAIAGPFQGQDLEVAHLVVPDRSQMVWWPPVCEEEVVDQCQHLESDSGDLQE